MKTKRLIIFVVSLLCWTLLYASNHNNAVKCEDKLIYSIFANKFTEPVEVVYFLMKDLALYRLTSNDETQVNFSLWRLKEDFKKNGHKISDIIVIIHNHKTMAYFSDSDIKMYRMFKSEGFKGRFYIYVWRNETIYELAERLR